MLKVDKNGFNSDIKRWQKMFISSLIAKGVKNNTISLYSRIINEFIDYTNENYQEIKLSELNSHIISNYLTYLLIEIELKKSTIKTKLTIIKSFFLYISEENSDIIDLMSIFKKINIKSETKQKEGYKLEDIDKVLEILERAKNSESLKEIDPFLKNLYFKLYFYTGLRVSEILNIKYEDFYLLDNNVYSVKILGKGDKERFVYIKSEIIEDELSHLLNIYNSDNFIAIKKSGKKYDRREIYSMFKSFFNKAKVKFKGMHNLRHTFARQLVSKNINLKTIQELLGHSDIQITAKIYAQTNENNKISAIQAMY